jgi:hypothetical protein
MNRKRRGLAMISHADPPVSAGRGRRDGWRAVVLRAGALAVAASMMAACAGPVHSADPAPRQRPAAPSGRAAEALYSYVPATGAQYAKGAEFSGTSSALQGDIVSACMRRSGFYVPHTSAAVYAAEDFDNSQWPNLAAISRSGMLDPGLLYGAQDVAAAHGQRRPYQAALSRCEYVSQAIFAPVMRAGTSLLNPWIGIVNKVQASAQLRAVLAGFSSCVKHAGTPVASAGSFDYFLAWVTGLEAAAPNQSGRLAVDRHWAPIFVRCAQQTVAVQDRLELAQQAVFLQEHRQQVRALELLADGVITKLQKRYAARKGG